MAEWIRSAVFVISENSVLSHLWELSISVSLMIVFLVLLRPFMKRLPRIGMYLLWVIVVVRIVVPFPVNGIYNLLPESAGELAARVRQSVGAEQFHARLTETAGEITYGGIKNSYRLNPEVIHSKLLESTDGKETGAVGKNTVGENKPEYSKDLQTNGVETKDTEQVSVDPGTVWVVIWCGGVLFCFLYVVCSLIMSRKMLRHAVHLSGNVYEHPYECSSFVGGVIFPRIYVPKGMSENDMKYILLHEKTHIRRWDYRVKPFAFLAFSLLWFNPLVWVAYRFMVRDMEISCDEMVIRTMGSEAKKRYSYLLLAMASGENGILCQNTAFGAGAVNERIHNVMKYKKPTKFMTVAVVLTVLFCGCGISSEPGGVVENTPIPEKETVYIEQTMPEAKIDWGQNKIVGLQNITVDPEGNIVQMGTLFQYAKNGALSIDSYAKLQFVDGEWQKAEMQWEETCKKLLKGKKVELSDGFYGPDGLLYLVLHEYPAQYYEDTFGEKYLHLIEQYLFRVDEKTGEVTNLKVPSEDYKKVVKDEPEASIARGLAYNSYAVFADGNYLVYNYGSISTVYSGATGEKVADVPVSTTALSTIEAGDDFLCWAEGNQDTKQIEVNVMTEYGENQYVLNTGVPYKEGEFSGIALGAKGNKIIVATEKGIFEAEYGDDEFTTIASSDKDNLYYLSEDGYMPYGRIVKGEAEDYAVTLGKLTKNDEYDEVVQCYYTKSE